MLWELFITFFKIGFVAFGGGYLLLAGFFHKLKDHQLIQSAFYGIRPVITGLIFFAGIRIALKNEFIGGEGVIDVISILLTLSSLGLFLFTRIHPVFIIMLSGFLGIFIYS